MDSEKTELQMEDIPPIETSNKTVSESETLDEEKYKFTELEGEEEEELQEEEPYKKNLPKNKQELQLEDIRRYVAPNLTLEDLQKKKVNPLKIAKLIWQKHRLTAHEDIRQALKEGYLGCCLDYYGWIYDEKLDNHNHHKVEDIILSLIEKEFKPLGAKVEEEEDGVVYIDFSHLNPEKAKAQDRRIFLSFLAGLSIWGIAVFGISKWLSKK